MQPLSFHTTLHSAPCGLASLHHPERSSWSLSLLRIMKTVNYSTKLQIVSSIFFPSNEDMVTGVMFVSTRCWQGSLRGARSHPTKAETVLSLFLQVTFPLDLQRPFYLSAGVVFIFRNRMFVNHCHRVWRWGRVQCETLSQRRQAPGPRS